MVCVNFATMNPVSKILFVILWWSNLPLGQSQSGDIDEQGQNPRYYGPSECGDILRNYVHEFSEYPPGDATVNINFLGMGDSCNHASEKEFLETMRGVFLNATDNGVRMRLLIDIWEKWRAETVAGSTSGRRICNPKRLLECHTSTSKCVCRFTMDLFDAKDRLFHEQISMDTVEVTKEIPFTTNITEAVKECRVKDDSVCQWNVPYLGFCAIPCANTQFACVGQADGAKRCRLCDVTKDIGSDGQSNKCLDERSQGQGAAERFGPPLTFPLILILRLASLLAY